LAKETRPSGDAESLEQEGMLRRLERVLALWEQLAERARRVIEQAER
jgi:hypothetical protein